MKHDVIWTQPPPVWPTLSVKYVPERTASLRQPVILRFTTDSFMDDFMNLLAAEPHRIGEFKVRPETWRGFTTAPEPPARPQGATVLRHLRLFRPNTRSNELVAATPLTPVIRPPNLPLKLYQAAHQRHYLITSSLVCRVPGMPDRALDPARDERVGFVVRRLLPSAANPDGPVSTWEECAWVPGPHGFAWRRIAASDARTLADREDFLPMFRVNFEEAGRKTRRLFAGVIPTGRRETYLGAPKTASQTQSTQQPGVTSRTSRKILLRKEVIEPWKSLVSSAQHVNRVLSATGDEAPNPTERQSRLKAEREQIQTVSWLILLDFARYLSTYLKPVWQAVITPALRASLNSAQQNAFDAIDGTTFSDTLRDDFELFFQTTTSAAYTAESFPGTLRAALAKFAAPDGSLDPTLEQLIEANDQAFDLATSTTSGTNPWPAFLFPLADPAFPATADVAPIPPAFADSDLEPDDRMPVPPDFDTTMLTLLARFDGFAATLVRALEDLPDPPPEPAVPAAAMAPADALRGWFVIRCVYDTPGCAPLHGAVVSSPTEPFEIAGFFDPDAPARPIRIGLPIDTTPAGLRKFDKNTALVISDTLCGQIRRIKGITFGDLVLSILPWPFHKDLPVGPKGPCSTGMICSLSIPIITLCALFLLMIMVALLNMIFFWLPFFLVCFPIPGLKAKTKSPA